MASDSDAKYKGTFWKFIAGVLSIAFIMLSIAFIIALYIIIKGGPSLDDVQAAHEQSLESEGYKAQSVKQVEPSTRSDPTFYDLLHADRDADMDEITSSYLSSASHFTSTPDMRLFIRLAQAYQTLSDQQLRLQYDTHLMDGQQYKQSDDAMSINEAMQIWEKANEEYRHHSIKSKFQNAVQSLISNSTNGIDDRHAHRHHHHHHHHGQVDMPSFPMVAQLVKMMGGPRIRRFHASTGTSHRIKITKLCVNGECKITIAHQVSQAPMKELY